MGLNQVRILENLDASYCDLANEYNSMVDKEKNKILNNVVEEFSKFFVKAKFDVKVLSSQATAKYKNSSVTLAFENPFGYAGLSIRMELTATLAAHEPQKMIVGFKQKSSDINISFSSSKQKTIDQQILAKKSDIENIKNKIRDFSAPSFQLFAKSEKTTGPFKVYDSLTDLLNEITA